MRQDATAEPTRQAACTADSVPLLREAVLLQCSPSATARPTRRAGVERIDTLFKNPEGFRRAGAARHALDVMAHRDLRTTGDNTSARAPAAEALDQVLRARHSFGIVVPRESGMARRTSTLISTIDAARREEGARRRRAPAAGGDGARTAETLRDLPSGGSGGAAHALGGSGGSTAQSGAGSGSFGNAQPGKQTATPMQSGIHNGRTPGRAPDDRICRRWT